MLHQVYEFRTGLVLDIVGMIQNALQLLFAEVSCWLPAIAFEIDTAIG